MNNRRPLNTERESFSNFRNANNSVDSFIADSTNTDNNNLRPRSYNDFFEEYSALDDNMNQLFNENNNEDDRGVMQRVIVNNRNHSGSENEDQNSLYNIETPNSQLERNIPATQFNIRRRPPQREMFNNRALEIREMGYSLLDQRRYISRPRNINSNFRNNLYLREEQEIPDINERQMNLNNSGNMRREQRNLQNIIDLNTNRNSNIFQNEIRRRVVPELNRVISPERVNLNPQRLVSRFADVNNNNNNINNDDNERELINFEAFRNLSLARGPINREINIDRAFRRNNIFNMNLFAIGGTNNSDTWGLFGNNNFDNLSNMNNVIMTENLIFDSSIGGFDNNFEYNSKNSQLQENFINNFKSKNKDISKLVNCFKNEKPNICSKSNLCNNISSMKFNYNRLGLDDLYLKCLDCEKFSNRLLCIECFNHSDHKNHRFILKSVKNGVCDCGVDNFWKKESFCRKHKPEEIDENNNTNMKNKQKNLENMEKLKIKIKDKLVDILMGIFKDLGNRNACKEGEFKLFSLLIYISKIIEYRSSFINMISEIMSTKFCDIEELKLPGNSKIYDSIKNMFNYTVKKKQITNTLNNLFNLQKTPNNLFDFQKTPTNEFKRIKIEENTNDVSLNDIIKLNIKNLFQKQIKKNVNLFDLIIMVFKKSNSHQAKRFPFDSKNKSSKHFIPFKMEFILQKLIIDLSINRKMKKEIIKTFFFQFDLLETIIIKQKRDLFKDSSIMNQIIGSKYFEKILLQLPLKIVNLESSNGPTLSQILSVKEYFKKFLFYFFSQLNTKENNLNDIVNIKNNNFNKCNNLFNFIFVGGCVESYMNSDFDVVNTNFQSDKHSDVLFDLYDRVVFSVLLEINKLNIPDRKNMLIILARKLIEVLYMIENSKEKINKNDHDVYKLLRLNFSFRFFTLVLYNLFCINKNENDNTYLGLILDFKNEENELFLKEIFKNFNSNFKIDIYDKLIRSILFQIKRKSKLHKKHEDFLFYELRKNYDKFPILFVKLMISLDKIFKERFYQILYEELNYILAIKNKEDDYSNFFEQLFYFFHEINFSNMSLEYFYLPFALNNKNIPFKENPKNRLESHLENIISNIPFTTMLVYNYIKINKKISLKDLIKLLSSYYKEEIYEELKVFAIAIVEEYTTFDPSKKIFIIKNEIEKKNSVFIENLFYLRNNFRETIDNHATIREIDFIQMTNNDIITNNEELIYKDVDFFIELLRKQKEYNINLLKNKTDNNEEYKKYSAHELETLLTIILKFGIILKKLNRNSSKISLIIFEEENKFTETQKSLSKTYLSFSSNVKVTTQKIKNAKIKNYERIERIFKKIRNRIKKMEKDIEKRNKKKNKDNKIINKRNKDKIKITDEENNNADDVDDSFVFNDSSKLKETCYTCQNEFQKQSDMFFIVKKNKLDPFKLMFLQKYWNNKKPLVNMHFKYFSNKNLDNQECKFDDKSFWIPTTCGHPYHLDCLQLPHRNGKYVCNLCKMASPIKLGFFEFSENAIKYGNIFNVKIEKDLINNKDPNEQAKLTYFKQLVEILFHKKNSINNGVSIYSTMIRPIEYIPKMMNIWDEDIFFKRIYPCLIFYISFLYNIHVIKYKIFTNFVESCIKLIEPIESFIFSPKKFELCNYFEMITSTLLTTSVEMLFVKFFLRKIWIEISKQKNFVINEENINNVIKTIHKQYLCKFIIIKLFQKNLQEENISELFLLEQFKDLFKLAIYLENIFLKKFLNKNMINEDLLKIFIDKNDLVNIVINDKDYFNEMSIYFEKQKKIPKKKKKRVSALDSLTFIDLPKYSISFYDMPNKFTDSYSSLIYSNLAELEKNKFKEPITLCGFCGKSVGKKTNHFVSFHGKMELIVEILDDIKIKTKKENKSIYESKYNDKLNDNIKNIEDFVKNSRFFSRLKNNIINFNI